MLFNSFHFLVFFPVTVFLYYLIPHKWRWLMLLAASYYFYMSWNPAYVVLILFTTSVNYFAGQRIDASVGRKRKGWLLTGLISSLGVLFVFKYFNFFNDIGARLLGILGAGVEPLAINVLLPVGISFYTFQTLSYTIDVYRGKKKAERHFGIFALYVSFFPQLVAGPIERSTRLLPQFYEKHDFDGRLAREGILQMFWGFFKKMVIADRLAMLVDTVYGKPADYTGWPLVLATVFFSIQIYCDFSAYSDIAIGSAKVMGFDLIKNFDRPYFARSIREFWRRWHISLSTWFRDYVYISLGGNRVGRARHIFIILITFILSGLWHGADITFLAWGAIHGILYSIEVLSSGGRKRFWSYLRLKDSYIEKTFNWVITASIVCFAWIFFRSDSISDARYISINIFKDLGISGLLNKRHILDKRFFSLGLNKQQMTAAFLSISLLLIIELLQARFSLKGFMDRRHWLVWWSLVAVLVLGVAIFGMYGNLEIKEFIYFKF